MFPPRTSALIWGICCNASMAALTKNDVSPSLTWCFFWKFSWCAARSPWTADISISLNVVSSAAVFCDSTSRSAILRRIGLIGRTRSSRPVVVGCAAGGAAAGWEGGGSGVFGSVFCGGGAGGTGAFSSLTTGLAGSGSSFGAFLPATGALVSSI